MLDNDQLNRICLNTLMETLQIQYLEVGRGKVVAEMPVTSRVHQPMGRLHGGATIALAESVASAGSFVMFEPGSVQVLGAEVSCSHISGISEGKVKAVASLIHEGKTSHIWEVIIQADDNRLISVCRITNRIIPVQS